MRASPRGQAAISRGGPCLGTSGNYTKNAGIDQAPTWIGMTSRNLARRVSSRNEPQSHQKFRSLPSPPSPDVHRDCQIPDINIAFYLIEPRSHQKCLYFKMNFKTRGTSRRERDGVFSGSIQSDAGFATRTSRNLARRASSRNEPQLHQNAGLDQGLTWIENIDMPVKINRKFSKTLTKLSETLLLKYDTWNFAVPSSFKMNY